MKKRYIFLITLGSILFALGTTAGSIVLNGTCFRSNAINKKVDLSNWMAKVNDEKLLNEIVIPGSHDAGCFDMNWLGKTQHLDIKNQLEIGVRYFDLRVNKTNNDYVIFHSIINGTKFDPILNEIEDFIKNNKSETLLLDFQHFKNGADEYVFNAVKDKLNDYLIINDTSKSDLEFVSSLKLKDVRGKCLVFFGDNSIYCDNNEIFSRNNDECTKENSSLDSCYISEYHSLKSNEFINKALPFYFEKIEDKIKKESHKGIFILQSQLTDSNLVFGPYSRERSHEENMKKYLDEIKDKDYFNLVNVIMRDFLDETKTEQIIRLNEFK